MRHALFVSLFALVLLGCAKPPTAEMDAARAALAKLEGDADVASYAPTELQTARDALSRMEAEAQGPDDPAARSRSYDTLKSLAAEVVRLSEEATTAARAARERAEWQAAEAQRLGGVMDAIDAQPAVGFGEDEIGYATGGSLEYLGYSAGEGRIALFDSGYPDTGMGEGFTPRTQALLCDLWGRPGVAEAMEGSRDAVGQKVSDMGYTPEVGYLEIGQGSIRVASRVSRGGGGDVARALYLIDDVSNTGVRLATLEMAPPRADAAEIEPEMSIWVTPDLKGLVAIAHREPANEYDAGGDTAVILNWYGVERFVDVVAGALYDKAATLAQGGEAESALQMLNLLKWTTFPRAEELLARTRTDPAFADARGSDSYHELMRTAFPTWTRSGLEELYQEYVSPVTRESLAGPLDPESLGRYGDLQTRITEGAEQGVSFAGHSAIVSWGCGSGCQAGVVVDLEDGKVYDLPEAASLGFEYMPSSRLLVVNPPDADRAVAYRRRIENPVYYAWNGTGFDLLADTRVTTPRGK